MIIRNLNNYETELVKNYLAEAEAEAEAKAKKIKNFSVTEEYRRIKAINSAITKEAKVKAELLAEFNSAKAEAKAETKAEVLTELIKRNYHIICSNIAEAEAKAIAEAEAEKYLAKAKAIAEAEAEAKETKAINTYYLAIDKAKAIAEKHLAKAEAEVEAEYIKAITEAEAEAKAIAESKIYYNYSASAEALIKITKMFKVLEAEAEAIAEAKIKASKTELIALAEAIAEAKAEANNKYLALVITSAEYNSLNNYDKAILKAYLNFNHIDNIKIGYYNKFEHKIVKNIVSVNITEFDNIYYLIIAEKSFLINLVSKLNNQIALTSAEKSLKRSLKKLAKTEAKKTLEVEAEAEAINNLLVKANNFNYLYSAEAEAIIKEVEAEAKAELEAKALALLEDNYFKALRIFETSALTEAEAETFINEAEAISHIAKAETSIIEYLKPKINSNNKFKNKRSINKINTLYGLVSSKASAIAEAETEAKNSIVLAEVSKTEAEAKAETNLVRHIIYHLKLYNETLKASDEYKKAIAEVEAEALKLQQLNFIIGYKHYKIAPLEALEFKKAIDL